MVSDREILEAALFGFQAQLKEVEAKISEIRTQLAGRTAPVRTPEAAPKAKAGRPKTQPVADIPGKKKRVMSASARERIAEAQKRRWAAHHAKQGEN